MSNEEKGRLYDEYVSQADKLIRENSKLNSDYTFDKPKEITNKINENLSRIKTLETKLENLFK